MSDKTWLELLHITEEKSSGRGSDEGTTLFYIRERPHIPGITYQSTALTLAAAEMVIQRLRAGR